MIYEGSHAFAINHMFAIGEPEQVGPRMVVVERISLFDGDARPRVLDDDVAFLNGGGRVATLRINLGVADNEVGWTREFSSRVTVELARG